MDGCGRTSDESMVKPVLVDSQVDPELQPPRDEIREMRAVAVEAKMRISKNGHQLFNGQVTAGQLSYGSIKSRKLWADAHTVASQYVDRFLAVRHSFVPSYLIPSTDSIN